MDTSCHRAMRRFGRQRAILAFAAGVIVIAGVLVVVLSRRSWRRVGDDGTPVQLVIGELPAGAVGCQPHEPLPAGTRAVRIRATPAGPGSVALRIVLREAGRYSGTGAVGRTASGGTVVAALPHPLAGPVVTSLCVWNTGAAGLALAGAATGPADQLTITAAGTPLVATVGRVRVDDLISARQVSLWSTLGKLPERIATATGSPLAPWLSILGAIGAILASVALLRSSGDGDEV
jgi:hypothetical protein